MEKDQHWHLASRLLHVTLAYTQLRLARRTIEDVHLPWEHARPDRPVLSVARVRQAFPQLLVTLGTLANAPKSRGRSPERPKAPSPAEHRTFRLSNEPPESATSLRRHKTIRSSTVGHPVLVKSQAKEQHHCAL
jgi:hypothetical protein